MFVFSTIISEKAIDTFSILVTSFLFFSPDGSKILFSPFLNAFLTTARIFGISSPITDIIKGFFITTIIIFTCFSIPTFQISDTFCVRSGIIGFSNTSFFISIKPTKTTCFFSSLASSSFFRTAPILFLSSSRTSDGRG